MFHCQVCSHWCFLSLRLWKVGHFGQGRERTSVTIETTLRGVPRWQVGWRARLTTQQRLQWCSNIAKMCATWHTITPIHTQLCRYVYKIDYFMAYIYLWCGQSSFSGSGKTVPGHFTPIDVLPLKMFCPW